MNHKQILLIIAIISWISAFYVLYLLISDEYNHNLLKNSPKEALFAPEAILSQKKRHIFIDWHLDSDKLAIINYKCLESLLIATLNDKTKIEVIIVGTEAADYYKVEHLLSKHTFQKYEKMGFNIVTKVHNSAESLFAPEIISKSNNNNSISKNVEIIGRQYYESELIKCCNMQPVTKKNVLKELPSLIWIYARIARLYTQGGEFYDLSWFHSAGPYVRSLSDNSQGVWIESFCLDTCSVSMVLYFPTKKSPVLRCALLEFENVQSYLHICVEPKKHANGFIDEKYSADCVKDLFNRCFKSSNVINELTTSQSNAIINNDYNSMSSSVQLQWLGPRAFTGDWNMPIPDETNWFYRSILDNNRRLAIFHSDHALNTEFKPFKGSCNHYYTDSSYKSTLIQQGQKSCVLSFVIPGFMKSGTTYLFDIIRRHPQVLSTLRGFGFKETGCYYSSVSNRTEFRADRALCFPFVEPHESMMFGDGTVYYIHRQHTAEFLKKENPNLKVLIIIRSPVERFKSHHRFLYEESLKRGMGDANVMANIALANTRMQHLRQSSVKALKDMRAGKESSDAIEEFLDEAINFNRPKNGATNSSFLRAVSAVYHCLYYHPIVMWDRIHGIDNVHVIEGERVTMFRSAKRLAKKPLDAPDRYRPLDYTGYIMNNTLEEEVDEMFRFIGLNPLKSLPKVYQHRTGCPIPKEHMLTVETKSKLEDFFEPFNELLRIYLSKRRSRSNTVSLS